MSIQVLRELFCFLTGSIFLFLYGFSLNLAPVEFSEVVVLYIATLFIVWPMGNYIAFKTLPTLPVIVGGIFIIVGGLIVTFGKLNSIFCMKINSPHN